MFKMVRLRDEPTIIVAFEEIDSLRLADRPFDLHLGYPNSAPTSKCVTFKRFA
jgi:hypothetical protein